MLFLQVKIRKVLKTINYRTSTRAKKRADVFMSLGLEQAISLEPNITLVIRRRCVNNQLLLI